MNAGDRLIDDLAGAILDGAPIDWPSAESTAHDADPLLVSELKVLAALSAVHRVTPRPGSGLSSESSERNGETAPQHWGHLRLLERIGQGAFGEVYRAWDTRLDREVALKLLPAARATGDRGASAIIHEGRLLARVHHPNVVTIHGADEIGDRIGLWMEFVRGYTLEQILSERKVVSAAEAVRIGLELCRAVSAVHGAGLLHRDIKTHNVMRADDGRIVLMDFGTGRELEDDASSDLAGTPLYLAPEVLHGQPATVQSDIYSLGVLLYHLVTGSYPVYARTVREVRRLHERGERTAVRAVRRDVPRKLAGAIERAIDANAERRYQSADALERDLIALTPRPRIVRLAYGTLAAGICILVAGAGWEVAGRQMGFSTTPRTLLAAFGVWVGATNASSAERPVIAVLPFQNLSTEPETDYFARGLTDEIIRNLAAVPGMQVRSRMSSFEFTEQPRNLPKIAKELGVNLVVDGSIMRSGSKVRINAELIHVAGGVPLWSDRFDGELEGLIGIQDEISRAIVEKLRLTLNRRQRRYETNLKTYELYLKARELANEGGTLAAQQAITVFRQVIANDPSFAPAYAGLADAYASASADIESPSMPAIRPEVALALLKPAAETALRLDPLLAEAHAAMGLLHSRNLDWAKAQESFRHAIDLNPTLTHVSISYSTTTLIPLGKLAEAEQLLRKALEADPLSLSVQQAIAWLEFLTGRYEDAVVRLQRIKAIDPHFSTVDNRLARALTFARRPADALRLLEAKRTDPGVRHWLARAYVLTGSRREVEKMATTEAHPYRLAVIYAALGDKDRALEALDRAAVAVPQRVKRLLRDPEMAALRDDPRFAAVRKKLNLP